jgi:hypothetical protein
LCDYFLTFQSIRRHFVEAKHSSCFVLEVFDGLWHLITPSDRKNLITECCSSLVQTESRAAMIDGKAAMMELA